MEQKTQSNQRRNTTVIIILLVIVIALLGGILIFSLRNRDSGGEMSIGDNATPKIGYAEGVTVVNDPDALQKAVDEMFAKAAEGNIMLEYSNDATSKDGQTFDCYIANALENSYDMYIQMFADAELTDQLLLTGLIRPGSAFDNITLERALDPGTHQVYVAFTQVEEDLATIHGQVMVTMDLTVAE